MKGVDSRTSSHENKQDRHGLNERSPNVRTHQGGRH